VWLVHIWALKEGRKDWERGGPSEGQNHVQREKGKQNDKKATESWNKALGECRMKSNCRERIGVEK